MSIAHARKNKNTVQTKRESSVSILDASSQNEALQRKADMANNAAQRKEAPRPNNTGMPDNLKSGIESLSGFSMDDVRVHYNSSKPATVQALAYTQGTDIHVAPGQEKHLPHEAWHVAQQMAGRVSPTTNINGMPVNDNAGLEHEADVMGEKAVQCKKSCCSNSINNQLCISTVQRMAYAKNNPDGTVSAETDQYEGDETLAKMFGRTEIVDGKYKRPDNVARKVDQYKKEMLTYIASCIQEQGEKNNRNYGPHISVVITSGIWFIAINSDYLKDGYVEQLKKDTNLVKNQIKAKWETLKMKFPFNTKESELRADTSGYVSDDLAKKQALYIVYRWAGKDKDVVVGQNQAGDNAVGVKHGEMQTIGFQKNLFDSEIYSLACKILDCQGVVNREAEYSDLIAEFEEKEAKYGFHYTPEEIVNLKNILDASRQKDLLYSEIYSLACNILDCQGDVNRMAEYSDLIAEFEEKEAKYGFNHTPEEIVNLLSPYRVIRVGGTKTPCYDCAFEMHVHKEQQEPEVHKGHQAEIIGGRKTVTMTPNFGIPFYNWKFKNEARPSFKGKYKSDELGYDNNQDQDYSELFTTFNSLDEIGENKMRITFPMIDVWKQRMDTFKNNESNSEYDLSCFDSLNLEKSLQLKSLVEKHLEVIYKMNKVENRISELSSDQNSLEDCINAINKKIREVNPPLNDEKIKSFVQYERLVIDQLNLNIQKKLADDEYSALGGSNVDLPNYRAKFDFWEKLNEFVNFFNTCLKQPSIGAKKNLWNPSTLKNFFENYTNDPFLISNQESLEKIKEFCRQGVKTALSTANKEILNNYYDSIKNYFKENPSEYKKIKLASLVSIPQLP